MLTRADRVLEALPQLEDSAAILERQLGPDHPLLSAAMTRMALASVFASRYAEGLSWAATRGMLLGSMERRREALATIDRALALRERAGDDNRRGRRAS